VIIAYGEREIGAAALQCKNYPVFAIGFDIFDSLDKAFGGGFCIFLSVVVDGFNNICGVEGFAVVKFDPALVISTEPGLLEGKQAMHQLLTLPDRPTAVFAVSDHLAFGALSSIKQAGLKVPQDLSLVGFDGVEFVAYFDQPLTTVRVPAYEMGRLAVKVLMDAIDQDIRRPLQYCLDADLIIRKSCSELR
jgi:DNA-binding LacI/PurR family transcriptional regulator